MNTYALHTDTGSTLIMQGVNGHDAVSHYVVGTTINHTALHKITSIDFISGE